LIEQGYSVDEEKRVLDVLARGLSREFPNPERVGCPDSSILRGIASHKLPLSQAAPWFDHLSACSPCFQDFNKFRREAAGQRRRIQVWLAAAAVLLFAFGGLLWVRSRALPHAPDVAVLDLRDRSVARGGNPADIAQPQLSIARTTKHLILELPIGSKEGSYEVALLNDTGDELQRATGTAQVEDQVVILRADVDFGSVRPGSYLLGVRRPGLEWIRFPARML
jgi:hypothetical protein